MAVQLLFLQLSMGAADLRRRLSTFFWAPEPFTEAARATFFTEVVATWLPHFEAFLPTGALYFVGARLTWVDILLFDLLDAIGKQFIKIVLLSLLLLQ